MKQSPRRLYLPIAYVVLVLLSTILATKISHFWFVSASTGIILYPITFILHDIIQKKLGRKVALQVIWAAGATMLFASLVFIVGGLLPADAHWYNQEAFNLILTPVFRITLASIIAGVSSELVNTKVFSWLFNKGYETWASIVSNFFGILTDGILFVSIAFLGKFPIRVVLSIFASDIAIKLIMAFAGSPTILLVKRDKSIQV